jgi:hypothetical protein
MVGRWVVGGLVGIVGVIGLYMAATVHQPGFYPLGLAVAAACVAYIFRLIGRSYDDRDGSA